MCFLPIDYVAVMISYTITYSILMLASLTGNSLLIYASVKSNIRMGVIIANMAASDIVFSIIHFPREIVSNQTFDSFSSPWMDWTCPL